MLGVLAAGVICLAAGLIIMLVGGEGAVVIAKVIVGIFMIALGAIMSGAALIVLLILLIIHLATKNKNKVSENSTEKKDG